MSNAYVSMTDLEERILKCNACGLVNRRCFPMEGPKFSTVMIVGQGPHPNRKIGQQHFSGRSAAYFKYLLDTLGLKREEVYITNVVKCIEDKVEGSSDKCTPFVLEEIKRVNPKEVFLLGSRATSVALGTKKPYGHYFMRGRQWYVLPHPASCCYGNEDDQVERKRKFFEVVDSINTFRLIWRKGEKQVTLECFE